MRPLSLGFSHEQSRIEKGAEGKEPPGDIAEQRYSLIYFIYLFSSLSFFTFVISTPCPGAMNFPERSC